VLVLFAGYAGLHSLLASAWAKRQAARWLGQRQRNGLYRGFFVAQATLLLVAAAAAFVRLPDRTLYRVGPPWSWLMHLAQVAGIGLMLAAGQVVGLARISGLGPLHAWLTGDVPLAEPEAQGPPLAQDGELRLDGPFRFTRHPANWGPLPTVLLFPHMTVNRAVLAALSVAYLLLGSVHEERRLRAAYGDAYDRYRARVPFLAPPVSGMARPGRLVARVGRGGQG
jgi:protein-S-isoprenylcysteine O-methyltransferase Ste14